MYLCVVYDLKNKIKTFMIMEIDLVLHVIGLIFYVTKHKYDYTNDFNKTIAF